MSGENPTILLTIPSISREPGIDWEYRMMIACHINTPTIEEIIESFILLVIIPTMRPAIILIISILLQNNSAVKPTTVTKIILTKNFKYREIVSISLILQKVDLTLHSD
jgi:hypothetical protein